ncbi:MAG TPA: triose-phosphate isomerase, partial [Magnetospirillaceae bacterium]|nr:triose-phosphate isomerase [Magnetospirillaceae bacterium]
MRSYYVAGNWKMHKTVVESVALARSLVSALQDCREKVMIAPAFTALAAVAEAIRGTNLLLGAQNMAAEEQGAHTGEVSVLMLKDLGVRSVILGHSERRHSYGETDRLVNRKVLLALAHGLEPILCVGETLEEREAGRHQRVVDLQLREGLSGVTERDISRVTIAYEPVWAIGTGKTATPEDADEVHACCRDILTSLYGRAAAAAACIQYGGSVK